MALRNDGTVWAWGHNGGGQVGDGTTVQRLAPVQVVGLTRVSKIAASGLHSLALRTDGSVWAWGVGPIGNGTVADQWTPVRVEGLNNVVAIAAAGHNVLNRATYSLALKLDGTVWGWGNNVGQFDNAPADVLTPIKLNGLSNVIGLGTGTAALTSFAVSQDGNIAAWGLNQWGQLGDGTTNDTTIPVPVSAAGGVGTLALGTNDNTTPQAYSDAFSVVPGNTFEGVLPGGDLDGDAVTFSIAAVPAQGVLTLLDFNTGAYTFGANADANGSDSFTFQVNDGKVNSAVATVAVTIAPQGITPTVTGGVNHTLSLKTDGTVWAWGANTEGQLGDGTTVDRAAPVQVERLSNVVSIGAGNSFSAALRNDGTVWVWGDNRNGTLVDGTTTDRYTPIAVAGLTDVTSIAVAVNNVLVLKADGTVWGWGWNFNGQLGDGTTTQPSVPVQAQGLTDVIAIATANAETFGMDAHSLALKSDGTVWSWGDNSNGQLGDGTTTQKLTPVQVTGLTDAIGIAAAGARFAGHSLALTVDGSVWAWGDNNLGQLGDGTTTDRLTPVQVQGLADVIIVSASVARSMALRSDGTVWAWGQNNVGQLGDGTTIGRVTPVQVQGLTNVLWIDGGVGRSSYSVKSDGTVWSWGENDSNQLADGTTTDSSVPVQALGAGGVGIFGLITGNPRPIAVDSTFTVNDVDMHVSTLVASDLNGDPLTFATDGLPSKGNVSITDASTGAFTYTPNPNTTGIDTFTFKANDGFQDSAIATVTVTIIDTVAPSIVVTNPTNILFTNQQFVIAGIASDNASGVQRVDLQITDGTFFVGQESKLGVTSAETYRNRNKQLVIQHQPGELDGGDELYHHGICYRRRRCSGCVGADDIHVHGHHTTGVCDVGSDVVHIEHPLQWDGGRFSEAHQGRGSQREPNRERGGHSVHAPGRCGNGVSSHSDQCVRPGDITEHRCRQQRYQLRQERHVDGTGGVCRHGGLSSGTVLGRVAVGRHRGGLCGTRAGSDQ